MVILFYTSVFIGGLEVRNRIDYYKYIIRYNKLKTSMFLIDAIVVIVALKVLIETKLGDIGSSHFSILFVLLGSIVKSIYDIYTLYISYQEINELKIQLEKLIETIGQ